MDTKLNIGWIGLGNMGSPMVKNLVKAGFNVTVYNRSVAKSQALKEEIGVAIAANPAELLHTADVVITMLSDDEAVKQIYEGENNLFSVEPKEGLIVVDMSTVSPETTQYLAGLCAERDIKYLDAPVAGSVKPAQEAQLVIMVGGEEPVYQIVKPVFDALGKASVYLGENGKANVAKLAVNLMLAISAQALSEAVIFAEKNGLSADLLLPIINNSAVASGMSKMKTENILNQDFNAAFALKLLAKDVRLASENGMDTPVGQTVRQTLQSAVEGGYGDQDMIAIINYLAGK